MTGLRTSLLTISAALSLSLAVSPSLSREAPQVDLRDVAFMIIGHQVCHTISLERVAIVGKRAAKREGISFAEAQVLLKGIYIDLVRELHSDPSKIPEVCEIISIMDRQIP